MLRRTGLALLLLAVGVIGGSAVLAPEWSEIGFLSGVDRLTGGGIGVERAGEAIPYGTHGQRLDVWRPSDASAGQRPVLLFFHGGAWRNGSARAYGFAGRALAGRLFR